MPIQSNIREQMKDALRAKDTMRLNVLRGLLAAFTNEAVAKKRKPDEELSDEEALAVISRAVRQRKDSIEQFEKGGRADLAETEKSELALLETYLPAQMSRDEITAYVKAKMAAESVKSPVLDQSQAGKLMGIIMKELKGRADGNLVKEAIDAIK